ncbi:MAG: HAD-IC family P-type ATPase [Ilumatobacteraceae bacterium]
MAHADPAIGLTAAAVADRQARGLVNDVPDAPTRTVLGILRGNVVTPVNVIIAILAGLVIAAGSPKDALFSGVIVANSAIGIVQELRAKRVLDRLSVLNAPRARVVRDGDIVDLHATELVLDDIIELRSGDQVVADGEIVADDRLEVDESLLTGEADPVPKSTGDGVLSGSAVVAGTGRMTVTRIGADHYAARLAEEARRFTLVDSQLRNDINRIVTAVGIAIIPVGLLLASSQFIRRDDGWRASVVSTVAGLVGMVPEGLVLLTSVAFAVGVVRLAARRCLVQELPAIEVLARVDVLCADKTGTITAGALAVASIDAIGDAEPQVVRRVLGAMARLDPDPNPTARALAEVVPPDPDDAVRLVDRVPFSSQRKWSAMSLDPLGTWVLGAPERVLGAQRSGLGDEIERHAALGSRVLVLAEAADAGVSAALDDILPAGLRPRALVLIDDVIRADAPGTLAWFAGQDVTVKVISGDNPVTVAAIARRAGLRDADVAVDASDLPPAGTDDFADAAERTTVFGRVTPHHKRDLVDALQARGHTVAMTGDGVNDVLALKHADCGIAMASGSEATRAVAQLVLLDSNFAALPAVVAEGRRVINNIERVASLFLAKTAYSVVLSVLTGVFALAYPLRPIHLSILSWFTIGMPAFFLALAPNDQRVAPGFLRRVLGRAVPAGLVIAALTMAVFGIVQLEPSVEPDEARTAAVLVAGAIALMNLCRTAMPLTRLRAVLVAAMASGFGLAFAIPAARSLFELPSTTPRAYATALAAIAIAWPLLALGSRVARRWGDG